MDYTRAVNTIRLYISLARTWMETNWLRVTVVYCAPGVEDISDVRMPLGSTVRDAIEAAQVRARRSGLNDAVDAGIWGRRCPLDQQLTDGDRVEIYRPLVIDPKEGRRARADLRRKRLLKN